MVNSFIIIHKRKRRGQTEWHVSHDSKPTDNFETTLSNLLGQSSRNVRVVHVIHEHTDVSITGYLNDYQVLSAWNQNGVQDDEFLVGHPKQAPKSSNKYIIMRKRTQAGTPVYSTWVGSSGKPHTLFSSLGEAIRALYNQGGNLYIKKIRVVEICWENGEPDHEDEPTYTPLCAWDKHGHIDEEFLSEYVIPNTDN